MSQATHEKNINGRLFRVSQFPTMRGYKIFHRLAKGLIPAIASVFGSLSGDAEKISELDIDGDGLGKAIEMLFTELDEDKSEALIRDLLSLTFVDGQEVMPQFDVLFQGDYGTLFKVLAFSVEVNFKSFLGDSGSEILKQKIPELLKTH